MPLDELAQASGCRLKPGVVPGGHVVHVHEDTWAVRLVAALVEVAGGDAVNEKPWRGRDAVLDGVPDFGGSRAGKAEAVDACQRAALPVKAGDDGGVDAF